MTTDPAVALEGVGKRYRIAERSLVQALRPRRSSRVRDLWAARDIDLRIDRGETIGILGRNGAGKSTLLRMMAGVSEPTTGRVTVRGRIAPLISVGVGFHQELTGRENVYVNGMLLGLTRSEVRARFDEIVAFAELEEHIDRPVKFYSSGMFMRLGFSVAVHVDPDVLLVDEVLAVGDVAFQLKCFDHMRALRAQGTTTVLVSHSMHAIQLLCPRAVLLDGGGVVFDGPSSDAIEYHHRLLTEEGAGQGPSAEITGPGAVRVDAQLLADGEPTTFAEQHHDLTLRAELGFREPCDSPHLLFRVRSEDGQLAYQYQTPIRTGHRTYAAGESATAEVGFRPAFGGGGTFRLELTVTDRNGRRMLGHSAPIALYVPPRYGVAGVADLDAHASIDGHTMDHPSLTLGPDDGG